MRVFRNYFLSITRFESDSTRKAKDSKPIYHIICRYTILLNKQSFYSFHIWFKRILYITVDIIFKVHYLQTLVHVNIGRECLRIYILMEYFTLSSYLKMSSVYTKYTSLFFARFCSLLINVGRFKSIRFLDAYILC